MSDTLTPLDVAIVGGGIAGISLLISFLRHENKHAVNLHMYEQAKAFGEIGAGVGFGSNAIRAMKAIHPGLFDDYKRIASSLSDSQRNSEGKFAWSHLRMGMDGRTENNNLKALDEIYVPFADNGNHNVHRATFLDSMLKFLSEEDKNKMVTFSKKVDKIDVMPSGRVRLTFTDGEMAEHDAIIGCDGVKSAVRDFLTGGQSKYQPTYTGKYAYRGLVEIEAAAAVLGEIVRDKNMLFGYGGHLVIYPIDQGRTLNVVAFTSFKDKASKWPHEDEWIVSSSVDKILEDFDEWSPPVKNLLSLLKQPKQWGIFDHPPIPSYYKGSQILVLGDAAHATSPHQGAGAGMALEDSACLGRLLANVQKPTRACLEAAFKAFDQVRLERSQKLVTTSRDAGLLYEFEKEGCEDNVERLRELCSWRFRWLWDHDSEDDCVAALKLMDLEMETLHAPV